MLKLVLFAKGTTHNGTTLIDGGGGGHDLPNHHAMQMGRFT